MCCDDILKMFFTRLTYIHIVLVICYHVIESKPNTKRIAIIGGGIGGTTAAFRLSSIALVNGFDFEMDLYEPGEVGGRLATTVINGFEFETGGSIIHNENLYMNFYVREFNLKKRHSTEKENKELIGLYDGNEFVFVNSQYSLVTMFKYWWRYGMGMYKAEDVVSSFISKFKRVYTLQHNNETFDDVYHFLSSLNSKFPALLLSTIKDFLLPYGFNDNFLKEYVFVATNVNYNQNTDIHAFAGAVALAGGHKVWSVQGGNKQVPEHLLKYSDARLVKKAVQSIVLLPDSKYALAVDDNMYLYDYVIIACPLFEESKHKITFEGFPVNIYPTVNYNKIIATFICGVINHTYFNYKSPEYIPKQIYSVNEDLFFNSISLLYPVTPDERYYGNVFKIFSKEILTDTQLDLLFLNRESVVVKEWFAYPIYDVQPRNVSFMLHENLFYVNAIEWAASCMETSALSGVNAALQILKTIEN